MNINYYFNPVANFINGCITVCTVIAEMQSTARYNR